MEHNKHHYSNLYQNFNQWIISIIKRLAENEYNSLIISVVMGSLSVIGIVFIVSVDCILFLVNITREIAKHTALEEKIYSFKIKAKQEPPTLVFKVLFSSIAAALILISGIKILRNRARNTNQKIIEYRGLTSGHTSSFSHNKSFSFNDLFDDSFIDDTFWNIYNAMNNGEVSEMLIFKTVPVEYTQKLHYENMSEFLQYLYAHNFLNEVEIGENALETADVQSLLSEYLKGAIDDFKKGDYYASYGKIQRYFTLYLRLPSYPITGENNKAHILNLLLEYPWELTTHRRFATAAISCVEHEKYINLEYLTDGDSSLISLCRYFDGISAIKDYRYLFAQTVFCDLADDSSLQDVFKQHCMLMAIRSAFWNYESERTPQANESFYMLCEKYEPYITLPYFIPNIIYYKETAKDIMTMSD